MPLEGGCYCGAVQYVAEGEPVLRAQCHCWASLPLDPLGLGLVTGFFSIEGLVLTDLSTAAVYRNATPIPEPGTAALLALVVLARRRRR